MPSWSGLQKFFGKTVSDAASYAAGNAAGETLTPYLQTVTNEAWLRTLQANVPDVGLPVDADAAADIVADDPTQHSWGTHEAQKTGIPAAAFDRMVTAAETGPGMGELMTMWRRGDIGDADFVHGLRKLKLEGDWDVPIKKQKVDRLDPAVIANAIVRGVMPAPFPVPYSPPDEPGKIPSYPVSNIDPAAEAMASGVDVPRLEVLTAQTGRPMAHQEAAAAYFKGLIEISDYNRAIAQGDTRPEYGPTMLDNARQIPTAGQAVENTLRGYADQATMLARTAKHGMSAEDTMILFENAGRPLAIHQITTGLARGGVFHPEPNEQTDPYQAAVRESDIKPPYYDIAIANRYTLPGYFPIRAMMQSGGITQAEGAQLFREEGWPPDLADKAAAAFAAGGKTSSSSVTTGQVTALVTATRKAYVAGKITQPEAATALTAAGIDAANQAAVFKLWDAQQTVEGATPPPPAVPSQALIDRARAAGYTVTPPPPPPPDYVLELERDGYTVTKP